ncbi:hypothetical protein ACFL3Q_13395, partial [Planctomycetota bacterium]
MATTDIHVRDARDRLIDLLGLGQTYPLRDLAVSDVKLTVAFNTIAKIPIEDSQKDVLYQLHHKHELVESTETGEEGSGVPIEVSGDGGTIYLGTYKIQEDTTFEILAIKQRTGRNAYLHQTATVKVGLNAALRAWIPDVPCLDTTLESPPDTAPRIVDYGRSVEVEIENSQEGVDYKLVHFRVAQSGEELEEVDLSVADVRGDLHNIIATTKSVYEDTDIRIRATKTFDPSEERDSQTVLLGALLFSVGLEFETVLDGGAISEALMKVFADQNFPLQNASVEGQSPLWLMSNAEKTTFTVRKEEDHLNIYRDTVLPLKVRANPALSVSVDPTPIIDYNNSATIKIADTQQSTNYQLYIRPIPDREFDHKVVPDTEVIKVSVEGEPDVQVQKPAREGLWITPEGYVEWGSAQQGTGNELELKIGPLTDDSLVIVRAQKYHQASPDSQTAQSVPSAVQLEQAAVVLVRPDPAPPLRVKVLMEGAVTSGDIQVFDGQPGIFYYFRQTPEGKEFEWPAYFHKRDDRDKSLNKGLDQLKLDIDFVVASDPLPGEVSESANLAEIPPESPILQTDPLPTDTTLD